MQLKKELHATNTQMQLSSYLVYHAHHLIITLLRSPAQNIPSKTVYGRMAAFSDGGNMMLMMTRTTMNNDVDDDNDERNTLHTASSI